MSNSLRPHGLQHSRPPWNESFSFSVFIFLFWRGLCPISSVQFSSVSQSAIPWTAAHQASLYITNSQSLLKLIPLSRWCHPAISSFVILFSSPLQSFPAAGSLPMSQFFASGGQSIGASASGSVLPMNIQDWFPLGLTGWISFAVQGTLKSLFQHHSSKASILWCSALFIVQLSHPYMTTGNTIALTRQNFVGKVTSLLFNSKQESPTLAAAAFTLDNTVMHKCRLSVPDLWFSREPCYQH